MAIFKQVELPDELLRSLERRAAAHGLSVEQQMLMDLREISDECETINTELLSEEEMLTTVRRERQELAARGVWMTEDDVNTAKRWGRK